MEWTIGELVERASAVLSPPPSSPLPPPSVRQAGRGRDVPNERLVRWYATIGLVDPPAARRGRVALYGRRHLLQLIAVKRRQAEGRSIAEIQAELAGATDQTLEAIARLPACPDGEQPSRVPRPRFWTGPPVPPVPARNPAPDPPAPSIPDPPLPAPPAPAPPALSTPVIPSTAASPVPAVRLAAGVTLLLDGASRVPSHDDLVGIATAAEALLAVLRERGLASPEGKP
ncbi:MerR family transcriptional regulator [Planomonospora sp. ID82291]|uniref:MerR family transcriptional regulator n=1 Tax=Planomonospora sp. ID82291 TaxID=2738136 RepID=UPI0018C41853|nr:MerR family transcriptional regulator [Planomonospora sp. ID82291]MBG0816301.1 MerR family transcriptional regulator [Planomonospora sp. ID82291]